MTLSTKQELSIWIVGTVAAVATFLNSHTFYVTAKTYAFGAVLLAITVALCFVRVCRWRVNNRPSWLTFAENGMLTVLTIVDVLYVVGVATYFE